MNIHTKTKQLSVLLLILITLFLFLFPRNIVYADTKQQQGTEEEMHTSNLSKFLLSPLGNLINIGLNNICSDLSGAKADTLLYTKDDIENNSSLKKEIDVKDEEKKEDGTEENNEDNENDDNIKIEPGTFYISNATYNKSGESEEVFTKDTPIPAIPLDIYTLSSGRVQMLDINFWKVNETNSNNVWNYIKDIIDSFAHIVLYISIGLIITMLIWRSVHFVYATMTGQPEKAQKSKKIMDNLFIVVLMVIGIYLFMIMCTLLHDMALNYIFSKDSDYPIRVVVDGVYSFNSTLTGTIKYLSLSSNISHQLGWSIAYLVFSFVCGVYFVLMYFRMLILGVLSIVAPLTAVMKMSGLSEGKGLVNILHFKNWVKLYLRFTYIPVVIALAIHIIVGI